MLPALAVGFLTASDWDRILTVAFPIVIVLACRVRLYWPFLVAFLVVQAVLSGLAIDRLTGYYREDLSHPNTSLTLALLVVALILVLLGALTAYVRAETDCLLDIERTGVTTTGRVSHRRVAAKTRRSLTNRAVGRFRCGQRHTPADSAARWTGNRRGVVVAVLYGPLPQHRQGGELPRSR
jgi:hypothetical protein